MSRAALVVLAALLVGCAPSRPAPDVLRVGTSGDYAPFSIMGPSGWAGFDVEVARRFAHDTRRQLRLVEFRWPALEFDLASNRFDVAMSGVTMRPWRARVGTFTRPVARVGAMLVTRPGRGASLADLDVAERRIGVNAGGHLERVARRLFRHAEVVPIADNRQLVYELGAGTVDGVLSDELEGPLFQRVLPDAILIGPLTNDRKAYLARDPALADELDRWLREREVDGSLAALRARALGPPWGLRHTATASDLDALLALIELRLAFMPAVALAKEQRGLPTEDTAREEQVLVAVRTRAALQTLPPERIVPLFEAILRASRAAQDRLRATPIGERPVVETMDLDAEARPALARISAGIVDRAADLARGQPEPAVPSATVLAAALDPSLAPADDRLAIAAAVRALIPAE